MTRFLFSTGDLPKVRARFPNVVMLQKPYNDIDMARAIETAMEGASNSLGVIARILGKTLGDHPNELAHACGYAHGERTPEEHPERP